MQLSSYQCCRDFYQTIKESKSKQMSLDTYAKKRARLHKMDPESYSLLSRKERLAIVSGAGREFTKLGLTYGIDPDSGICERIYFIKG